MFKTRTLKYRDYASKIDEISESVMQVLTEFEDAENIDQFLISVFINGLNLEIKKLIGIQEFDTYNHCLQTALKAEKLLPSRSSVLNVNDGEMPNFQNYRNNYNYNRNFNNNKIICYHCEQIGHVKRNCPLLNKRRTLLPNPPKIF